MTVRRLIHRLLMTLALLPLGFAHAAPAADAKTVKVQMFFMYGCSHCAQVAPALAKWMAAQAPDVSVERVPVSFGRGPQAAQARLFYSLQATNLLGRLDAKAFAPNQGRSEKLPWIALVSDDEIIRWVAQQGVDATVFAAAYRAPERNQQIRDGDQLAQTYRIDQVPAIVVDGRVVFSGKPDDSLWAQLDQAVLAARSAGR